MSSTEAGPPPTVGGGRYTLGDLIGRGGAAEVFRARDELLGRDVAVKQIDRDRVVDGRGRREAVAAARLHHPAIVALYEAEEDAESTWLVSEYVRGAPLDRLLADGALSDRDVAEIGVALADIQKFLDPEVFVIGGGVASVGDLFFGGIQAAADEYAGPFAPVTIRRAQLGTEAGVIGGSEPR